MGVVDAGVVVVDGSVGVDDSVVVVSVAASEVISADVSVSSVSCSVGDSVDGSFAAAVGSAVGDVSVLDFDVVSTACVAVLVSTVWLEFKVVAVTISVGSDFSVVGLPLMSSMSFSASLHSEHPRTFNFKVLHRKWHMFFPDKRFVTYGQSQLRPPD